ncbi:hypothetical protein HNQ94_002527 [Salirhabdus euzebyi]|uniref:Uncharacterized protein n=1 Tax=Salirhabdus euzebyi TaxID=394506 RepID=A0A841Q6P0_9BACI|nr:hypothetical protein [Salirhabdus euzebyi]MBB6454076.1 hypothetical protein [Salirhabdus euzebyi]
MWKFIVAYFIFQLVLFIVILLLTNRTDKKSATTKYIPVADVPEGFQKTSESFLDNKTNQPVFIYYNPTTGKRIYVQE